MNDWLDIEPENDDTNEGEPAGVEVPALQFDSGAVAVVANAFERQKQFVIAWETLTQQQRIFLNTWRESRFNANRAIRVLKGTTNSTSKSTISNWSANPNFEYVRALLRTASVDEVLSRNYLVARQEDIIETLLTPKPILHQGIATGHFEVEAGAASAAARANEALLDRVMPKPRADVEVNVGVAYMPPSVEIQKASGIIDAEIIQVEASPVLPDDDEWLK